MKNIIFKNSILEEKGLGMVEMLVVLALIMGTFMALLQLTILERRSQVLASQRIKATVLAEQALESTRNVRDKDWDAFATLSLDTPYYPEFIGNEWILSLTNPGPTDIYTVFVQISGVLRDGADNISATGTPDGETRQVTSTVSWTAPGGDANNIDIATYFTNWQAYQ